MCNIKTNNRVSCEMPHGPQLIIPLIITHKGIDKFINVCVGVGGWVGMGKGEGGGGGD